MFLRSLLTGAVSDAMAAPTPTPAVAHLQTLNSGHKCPSLGFGTWQAAPGVVGASVEAAVKAGFRHIDCAFIYRNQEEIGAAFTRLFDAKTVARSDLFVTSKLWNTDHHPDHAEAACRLTLKQLGLEYLDLYLVHWPVAWKHGGAYEKGEDFFPENDLGGADEVDSISLAQTWAAMEALVAKGLVKSIGVSNVSRAQLEELRKSWQIPPAMNQIEVHPFLPQRDLIAYQTSLAGILTTAYCPLGVGMGSGEELTNNAVFNHPDVKALAEMAGVSSASLCLQWNLNKGNIVLSKSVTESRIVENAQLPVNGLAPETVAAVDGLFAAEGSAHKRRVCNPQTFHAMPQLFFEDAWAMES